MKELEHAYTAGIIDGEGTITLSKRTSQCEFRMPVVSCSSTTYELLVFLKEKYGGSISKHKVYQDHHKQSWSWKVQQRNAISFLNQILPYMKEPDKIRRSQLILDQYLDLTPRNGKYTESMKIAKKEFENNFFHPSDTIA